MTTHISSVSDESRPVRTSHDGIAYFRNVNPRARVVISKHDSEWYEVVQSRLEELVDDLRPGWDGYNGRPVSFLNASFALSMLSSICRPDTPAPQIVPGSDGDLQIEWHTDEVDIELAVRGPYVVNAWRWVVGDDPDGESLELSQDFTEVANWVSEILEHQVAADTAAA